MIEKRFKLSKYATPSSVSYFCDENGRMLNKEVVKVLNEQLSIIRRDEIAIKTMMSNMKKLEEANDNMNLFIKQTIEPLLFNCVFELNTIESMSQVELAKKIENEIIPFIQNFKYLKYESPEEEKQDKSE